MSTELDPHLAASLRTQEARIAERWHEAITRDGFVSQPDSTLTRELAALAGRTIDLMLTEEWRPEDACAIGAELAEIGRIDPAAYGSLLDTLIRESLLAFAPEGSGSLPDRIVRTVAAIAAGFLGRDRERVVEGQEAVRRALLAAEQEAHEALRASEERYRAVVTQAREGIVLSDASSRRIVETNAALQALLGYSANELAALTLYDISANEPSSIDAHLRETLRNRRHDIGERWLWRKDGSLVPVESSAATVVAGGQVLVCALVRDVSERVEAEEELMAAQRLLADARETERLRIAQELHDSVVQDLLGLRYQLSAVATGVRAGGAPDEAAASLQGVEDQLATTVSRVRDLIAELRPTGLDEAGLVGALENLAADARSGDTQVTLDIDPGARELARPTALCLFRVAQEAVRNALQHADPRHVTVRLRLRPRAIVLRVSDDGRGFVVPDHLGTLTRDNHFGLVGMAERVGQAGGRLRLRSRPGRGTSVTAWLPPVTLDDARGSHNDTD